MNILVIGCVGTGKTQMTRALRNAGFAATVIIPGTAPKNTPAGTLGHRLYHLYPGDARPAGVAVDATVVMAHTTASFGVAVHRSGRPDVTLQMERRDDWADVLAPAVLTLLGTGTLAEA